MRDGDFFRLLPDNPFARLPQLVRDHLPEVDATTVFAFHYADGVIMAGDHRATAGNHIFSDRIDKILRIDHESIMAIAGSPAVALEMARTLETSFEYYRRSQLQSMSLQAKTRTLSRLLKENIPATLQGIGTVIPIFAGLDHSHDRPRPTICYYDPLGAQFETTGFAASGSGSDHIRGVLAYLEHWGQPSPALMNLKEAVILANRLLMTCARFDSATGGIDPRERRYATVMTLTPERVSSISEETQAEWWTEGSAPTSS